MKATKDGGGMGAFAMREKEGGRLWILFERINPLKRCLCLGSLPVSDKFLLVKSSPLDDKTHNTRRQPSGKDR